MFEIYKFSQPEIFGFILVLIRVSAFIIAMPMFGTESVPRPLKIFLSLLVSFLIFPTLKLSGVELSNLENSIIWLTLREVSIGLILGFVSRLFFFALSITGEILSVSIGLSSEQLFNPTTGGRSSAIQQFQVFLGSLFFLAINGHHYLIAGLVKSFEVVPLSVEGINAVKYQTLAHICQEVIWLGIKMGAPVMAAVFFMNFAMGILGRTVPQINVLITSLPVNALVGFFIMIISIPLMVVSLNGAVDITVNELFQLMKEL